MGQQEGFRTPAGGADAAPDAPAAPFFDERSALRAAPVVPLEMVARRSRFANWSVGGWRETVRSPQFRRSWPLALLLVATLAAAVAASNIYSGDEAAQTVAPATGATTAETADDTAATADAQKPATSTARSGIDGPREARNARREREQAVGPDEKAVGSPEAFTASALGNFIAGEADGEQPDAAASGRDARDGERDKGKRHKRSKRGRGARRGGAILFDVIR
jgi:hypothetical protein